MPRFVLLYHDWPGGPRGSHCDLMFETGESLATWALTALPVGWQASFADPQLKFASTNGVAAERLPDHRLAYLECEGPVSGGRGFVRQLDAGTYSPKNYPSEFAINGAILQGTISLQSPTEKHAAWRLAFSSERVP